MSGCYIPSGSCLHDLRVDGATLLKCSEFGDAIIENMGTVEVSA